MLRSSRHVLSHPPPAVPHAPPPTHLMRTFLSELGGCIPEGGPAVLPQAPGRRPLHPRGGRQGADRPCSGRPNQGAGPEDCCHVLEVRFKVISPRCLALNGWRGGRVCYCRSSEPNRWCVRYYCCCDVGLTYGSAEIFRRSVVAPFN